MEGMEVMVDSILQELSYNPPPLTIIPHNKVVNFVNRAIMFVLIFEFQNMVVDVLLRGQRVGKVRFMCLCITAYFTLDTRN